MLVSIEKASLRTPKKLVANSEDESQGWRGEKRTALLLMSFSSLLLDSFPHEFELLLSKKKKKGIKQNREQIEKRLAYLSIIFFRYILSL